MASPHEMRQQPDLVRPFMMTRGRTRPSSPKLRVETVVETIEEVDVSALMFEQRSIAELCTEPLSIAEISALLKLPLGVVRVLVGDLHLAEVLAVHETKSAEIELEMLDRLIERVEAL